MQIKKSLLLFMLTLAFMHTSVEAKNVQNISLQLQWFDQFQFAGYYMAKEKGYYKKYGLSLEIKKYKPGINVLEEVREGRADYGISGSKVLLNAGNGEDILLLAAIFQSSPLVAITTKSTGIRDIKDFKGKKVMGTLDLEESLSLKAMLRSEQLSLTDMTTVKHARGVEDLLKGKVDVMTAYISNEPFVLTALGKEVRIFDPKDYGFDFYSDILFTYPKAKGEENKKIQEFTEASLKGWEYAFEHMKESVDFIYEHYNTQGKTKEALMYEAKALKKQAYYKGNILGNLDINKLEKMLFVYKLLGFPHQDVDLARVVYKPSRKLLNLSEKEKLWIKNHDKIRYSEVNWKPLSIIEKGKMKGIMGEYLDIVSEKTGLKFEFVPSASWPDVLDKFSKGKIDLIPGVGSSEKEKSLGIISDTYATYPMAIVTGKKYHYINGLSELEGKVVAVPKYFTSYNVLTKNYPKIKIVSTKDISEALLLVNSGVADAFVGHIATSLYYISEQGLDDLKISGTTSFDFNHHYLVHKNNSILLSIFNKAFATISEQERAKINVTWVQNTAKEQKDYSVLLKTIIGLSAVIAFIVLLNYRLKNVVRKKTEALHELNAHLEELVQDRTVKLEQSRAKLQELADHDPLTNLYNRRYLLNISQELIFLARRNRIALSVVMLDIDKFKEINDTHGHSVGDDVILCIVKNLNHLVRESDVVARYGGEEFVILLPETTCEGAEMIAEKIRKSIENDMHCSKGKEIGFTASFGVSEVNLDEDSSIMAALDRADEALYKAKSQGRNKVECN